MHLVQGVKPFSRVKMKPKKMKKFTRTLVGLNGRGLAAGRLKRKKRGGNVVASGIRARGIKASGIQSGKERVTKLIRSLQNQKPTKQMMQYARSLVQPVKRFMGGRGIGGRGIGARGIGAGRIRRGRGIGASGIGAGGLGAGGLGARGIRRRRPSRRLFFNGSSMAKRKAGGLQL